MTSNELNQILGRLRLLENCPRRVVEQTKREIVEEVEGYLWRNPIVRGEIMPRAIFERDFKVAFGISWNEAVLKYIPEEDTLNVEQGIIIA